MNSLIEEIFKNFKVDNVLIPVSFAYYDGHNTSYIVYINSNTGDTFYSDDGLRNYVEYYDFSIYSKGNYFNIIESVKNLLGQNGFEWQPSLSSSDLYEEDTGYFHKTLCFAYIRNTETTSNNIVSA